MIKGSINNLENLKALSSFSTSISSQHDHYRGRGKLLLSGEYALLEGAKGLALPTRVGQNLHVKYVQSFNPLLHWKSFDFYGNLWLEVKFEFWHFNFVGLDNPKPEHIFLQSLLRNVRKQNSHFLRDQVEVQVETTLDFPKSWGLGSSSTLIYNVAQWGYVSPFELLFKTTNGSGYDIACAQSNNPIFYERTLGGPRWSTAHFNPGFKNQLYLIHLNQKISSRDEINRINPARPFLKDDLKAISQLTEDVLTVENIADFQDWMVEHEARIGRMIKHTPIKKSLFRDFPGEVKSLGAWGGDFILAASDESFYATRDYFNRKGNFVVMPYDELIMKSEADRLQ